MTVAIAVGLIAGQTPRRAAVITAAVFAVTSQPLLAIPAAALVAGRRVRARIRASHAARDAAQRDLATLAEMTVVGLTGGLGIRAALSLAAESLDGPIAEDARSLLRRVHVAGAPAYATHKGPGADLYRVIGRAEASGSSLLEPVTRFADELEAELASARLEAVRRLPVAMLFPLTLLILPGFLLLTVAPALIEAFSQLEL